MQESLLNRIGALALNSLADVPEAYNIKPVYQKEILIDGVIRHWDGPYHKVYAPIYVKNAEGVAERVLIGEYPLATEAEALEALAAADAAYNNGLGEWPTMGVEKRIEAMRKFTTQMIACREEVVNLIMWEIGKSRADSEKEFDRTVEYIRLTIEQLKELDREHSRFIFEQGIMGQIRRSPLGVVLCMGPFNYPLNETFTLLIPALIMGNTILFKPPKHGTLLFSPLLKVFQECFPKGVVNTVYGRGANTIPTLMKSGKVNVLALIGSSRVADDLKKMHPRSNRLRAILGLDAKNAAIILPDANLDETVKECVLGALSFNGQRCTALKIFFVHSSIKEAFMEKMKAAVAKMQFGLPWEKGVQLTQLPEPNKIAYLNECLSDAKAKGASIINEEEGGGLSGHSFMFPAIVYPVKPGMKLYTEEQFGPILPICSFTDINEPINYLIESDHGQQVSIFGNTPSEIAPLIDQLANQVSRVNLNAQCQRGPDTFPFTGRKDSAEGTLSVLDAIRTFSIRALIATKENEQNKELVNHIVNDKSSTFLSTRYLL